MNNTPLRLGDTGAAVTTLQARLNQHGAKLVIDHIYGPATAAAVRAWQRAHGLVADGIAGPRTELSLLGQLADKRHLSQSDVEAAATALSCDPAAIQAVIEVESPRGGFLPDGRAVILYERHIMYRQLKDAGIDPAPWMQKRPDIVNTRPGGYLGGNAEYGRLATAKQINTNCALASCSWGRFQIMGEHWKALDYPDVATFVHALQHSEAEQLRIFVAFIRADPDMHKDLQEKDWPAFAAAYNGPAYAENHYATRLATAYADHATAAGDKLDVPAPPPPADVGGDDLATAKPRPRKRKAKAAPAVSSDASA